jgi:hypothetical protein
MPKRDKVLMRQLWMGLLLVGMAGCRTAPPPASTPSPDPSAKAIDAVVVSRVHPEGLTRETLVEMQSALDAHGQPVSKREWRAVQLAGRWTVTYTATLIGDQRSWQWTVEPDSGSVTPANDAATQLDTSATALETRLTATPEAVAPPPPPPAATVTVTVTPTETVAAAPPPTAAPPKPEVKAPPPKPKAPDLPPPQVVFKGLVEADGVREATLEIGGQYFQVAQGQSVAGYRVVRILPNAVQLSYQGKAFLSVLPPHAGIEFTPAQEAPPAPPPAPENLPPPNANPTVP